MDLPSLAVVGAVVAAAAAVVVVVVVAGTGLAAAAMGVEALARFSTSLADEPGRFDPPPPDGDGVGVELD